MIIEASPYNNESLNRIYELLFCDDASLFRPDEAQLLQYPYNRIFAEHADVDDLQAVTIDESIEARLRILAARKLKSMGQRPADSSLMAVIVEVGLEGGLDVVAAFCDGTARYINHAEKIVFWDAASAESMRFTNAMLEAGEAVVKQIGPWKEARPPHPSNGNARISFIAAGEWSFGQGPFSALFNDPMAAPVLDTALQLMKFLTQH